VHVIEVHDVRTWNFVYLGKIFRFLLQIAIVYPKWWKYPPISDEVSITSYLKQNAIDDQGHLTIEISWRSKKCSYFENKQNSPPRTKRMGTSIGVGRGAKGTISSKFLAFLVILFFERRCRKQNTVARFKWKDLPAPNLWAGYSTIGTRRDKHPKKQGCS